MMPLQQRLAALRPDELAIQYTLIDMLLRLAVLRDLPADGLPTRIEQAEALYQELQQRDPSDSILRNPVLGTWAGMLSSPTAMVGVLTLLLGMLVLRIFRRRVAR